MGLKVPTVCYPCFCFIAYIYRWTSIKRTCKLSVCISKNLRWLTKQVKRVLRNDTWLVSRLYDFQVWLQCWRYHYCLLIWRCLSNFEVRYLCAYVKSHRSDVSSANLVEATFAVIYLCLFFSVGLNFSTKYVSYDSLKILLSSRIAKNGIIFEFPPPHVLIWPSTSICCSSGCRICCL